MITVTILYTILGFLVPLAIPDIESLATINWRDYSAGYSQDDRPWWTYLIAYFVVLFPALDCLSILPIVSITLSDNFISLFFDSSGDQDISMR